MKTCSRLALCLWVCLPAHIAAVSQEFPTTVIWAESDVPAADSPAPPSAQLAQIFPKASLSSTDQLATHLANPQNQLLILPYGSAIPEAAWSVILDYLHRGGNLLVIGGRPFTRAAYHDALGWHLRDYSVRFARPLLIDQYQATPGSSQAEFTANADFPLALPHFAWQQAYSPLIHLSTTALYNRGGSAGALDVRLDPLVWGTREGRRLSAPLLEVDHFSSGFDGGRWILLAADLAPSFFSAPESTDLLRKLAARAIEGSQEFTVRPTLPLYLPGEVVELETIFHSAHKASAPLSLEITTYPEDEPQQKRTSSTSVSYSANVILSGSFGKGFHVIEARLLEGTAVRAIYHSGFWIRDENYLRSGSHLTVSSDYFELDGKPLAVVGTTYMSSEVQRLYFDHPNVYVWNRDFAQIHAAGINMVRTGWWTGWEKFCDETGRPYERTLRTLEAYLMTARKFGLPVQFNFFAFLPEVLGGADAYLDPGAIRKQQTLVSSVAARFHDVPFLAWDLINEPSFSKHLWVMRPDGDAWEVAAWNRWLAKKYPDRAALAAAWNLPPDAVSGAISVPTEQEFDARALYFGVNALRVYDYFLFAQETFADWVGGMRGSIRAAGASQPITVGQDEGGFTDRLSPAFFASNVDFTTNHSWWENDSLLWDSLVAKQPGRAMLIQETGIQRQLTRDEISRLTPEQEAALFERKFAMSFVEGSGAIQWLWNTNSYMTEGNEVPIGALHADGSEKPEATVLRGMARFALEASPYLEKPKSPPVTVVTSQTAQFSVQGLLQLTAQRNAVRALGYNLHQPCSITAENQIAKLGSPKLVILPSPQALLESTWQALLNYVKGGGNLLVTGAVARDEHWHLVDRLSVLGINAAVAPLTSHDAAMSLGALTGTARKAKTGVDDTVIPLSFDQQQQQLLEYLKFEGGSAVKEFKVGAGRLFWASYPVELSQEPTSISLLYRAVLDRLALKASFSVGSTLPEGILIYPVDLQDAVLYVFESEADRDAELKIYDFSSGGEFGFVLPAQHAVLALLDRKTKRVVAHYGF